MAANTSLSPDCISRALQPEAVGVIFKKLQPFTEYNITVTAHLDIFNASVVTSGLGRTRELLNTYLIPGGSVLIKSDEF